MPDSTLAALTSATAGTGGFYYGIQGGADRKFTMSAAGATLAEAANAAAQLTALGAASTAANTFTGAQTITGGTVTDSTPLLSMSQTWNDAADTFHLDTANVTNTASQDASTLIRRQVGGVDMFSVSRLGKVTLSSGVMVKYDSGNSSFAVRNTADSAYARMDASVVFGETIVASNQTLQVTSAAQLGSPSYLGNGGGLQVVSSGHVGFSSGALGAPNDLFAVRAAAATWQQGLTSASPVNQTFKGPNGSGTDIVAGDLSIAPGQSTGEATPASIRLKGTVSELISGSSSQALIDHLVVGNNEVSVSSGIAFRLGNVAVSETLSATHSLIILDSSGTEYKILCAPA